jgi:predicted AlkP superfamily pyrophosphatase or phosphodiesterase
MQRRTIRPLVAMLAFIPLFAAAHPPVQARTYVRRPRLVVVIVIDQFRYDYLVRFRPQFSAGGFNLLLSGASFSDCRYDYATTITGPGHATLFTGTYSNIHGIIENEWYDRTSHHMAYCVADPDTRLVGGTEGPGASPTNLLVDTLGDELRLASNFQSKVIAISLKDRAAVLPGGHTANAAYWWDSKTGHFVTSTYYMPTLPTWVAAFNQSQPARAYCGQKWQALAETPDAGGQLLGEFHPQPGEPCPDAKFLAWLDNTPYMNQLELKFAAEAIRQEHLGQGWATDLLAISLSVNDHIGHAFGPYSAQVVDTTIRTDRDLAEFFRAVDGTVGLDHCWIALSADHGVAPNPAFIKLHHLGIGNFPTDQLRERVEQALRQAFGDDQWVEASDEFYIYLNRSALEKHHVDEAKAESVAAAAAASSPGVYAAFTRIQFFTSSLPASPLARQAANSFNPKRSGDVFLVRDPYAVPAEDDLRTTHGSPWNYDSQVPLVFWGDAFKPGVYASACEPVDLAATLAAALGLTQPAGSQGRPLTEAMK